MTCFTADQRILVTGASSGIGKALALKLCGQGATVIATGRDKARLGDLCREAVAPERMFVVCRDLTTLQETLPDWIRDMSNCYGKLSGLACCAGINIPMSLATLDTAQINAVLSVNCLAPILLAKGFADRRANTGPGAAMVFIASIAAHAPLKGQLAYAASKAALVSAVRNIAQELGKWGIRANCVSPGALRTPMTDDPETINGIALVAEGRRKVLKDGSPEDVASLATFLLSDEASWITGQNYVIDGGRD